MTAGLSDGGTADRRLISELDLDILAGLYSYTVNKDALLTFSVGTTDLPEPSVAVLLVVGLLLLPMHARRKWPASA